MNIGIVGNGYVGKATALFGCKDINVLIYDKDPDKCEPKGTTAASLAKCDLIFICVPTPMDPSGTCNTSIVEGACVEMKEHVMPDKLVIRSTVPVGTARYLEASFMPEFLTEANWEKDVKNCKDWLIGLRDVNNQALKDKFFRLFDLAYRSKRVCWPHPTIVNAEEAELVKTAKNSFLAVKVAFFNELEEFCRSEGLEYETVRQGITADPRITQSHTKVPGPDGKRGFGGTCFPKDIQSFYKQLQDADIESYMVEGAIARNNQVDRPEKDWEKKKGRAIM